MPLGVTVGVKGLSHAGRFTANSPTYADSHVLIHVVSGSVTVRSRTVTVVSCFVTTPSGFVTVRSVVCAVIP